MTTLNQKIQNDLESFNNNHTIVHLIHTRLANHTTIGIRHNDTGEIFIAGALGDSFISDKGTSGMSFNKEDWIAVDLVNSKINLS